MKVVEMELFAAPVGAQVAVLVACALVTAYCLRSILRQAAGLERHTHADGVTHSHHRGSVPHTHRPHFGDPAPVRLRRDR